MSAELTPLEDLAALDFPAPDLQDALSVLLGDPYPDAPVSGRTACPGCGVALTDHQYLLADGDALPVRCVEALVREVLVVRGEQAAMLALMEDRARLDEKVDALERQVGQLRQALTLAQLPRRHGDRPPRW